jgi:hypothetical protein
MPRILWISALVGFTAGVVLALVVVSKANPAELYAQHTYGPRADPHPVYVFSVWAFYCGFFGGLIGSGIGSVLYAPVRALVGAVIACLPFVCIFALSCAAVPPSHPSRGDEHWFYGVLIFAIPALVWRGFGRNHAGLEREQKATKHRRKR